MIPPRCSCLGSRFKHGYALVVTLIMVALLAVITVGVYTTVSLDRTTAKSFNDRYQADLAAQNGLQEVKNTLLNTIGASSKAITKTDTFLITRAEGPVDANGNRSAYFYLAQPTDTSTTSASITYYPLFSTSATAAPTPQAIDLTANFAPSVPSPDVPVNSTRTDTTSAWNAANNQRLPTLYPWAQPSTSPSGPSVKWVEMRNPQDPTGPYARYAYWAEDLGGYLDAAQVGGQTRAAGNSPKEIALWTIFNDSSQTDPGTTAATNLLSNRSLLFTVPTVQQVAQSSSDVAGANLAVRLGIDPAEQVLVPTGFGYGSSGSAKVNLNPLSQLKGNVPAKFAAPITSALPSFSGRSGASNGGHGHSGTVNYLNNLAANIVDYASPQNAPTEFLPNGNQNPPSARGVGAYPFVTSIYDLYNWVFTYGSNSTFTYHVVVEVKTYVQLWNPHNLPLSGALTIHYENSDSVNLNGTPFAFTSPPDTTVVFTDSDTDPVNPDPNRPVIISPLAESGNVGVAFNYQIRATNSPTQFRRLKQNEYRVVVLPGPSSTQLPITRYGASGLPPGLNLKQNGNNAGLISGSPSTPGTYNVTISATNSAGTTSASLIISISP